MVDHQSSVAQLISDEGWRQKGRMTRVPSHCSQQFEVIYLRPHLVTDSVLITPSVEVGTDVGALRGEEERGVVEVGGGVPLTPTAGGWSNQPDRLVAHCSGDPRVGG